jgi:putative tricarboxylic transport membrane protein
MRIHDAITGLLLAMLAVAVLVAVSQYPPIPGQNIGPSAFPGLVAGLLLICSCLLIWRGLRGERRPLAQFDDWVRSPRHILNVVLILGALLFYVLLSDVVGFIPSGILILAVLFFSLGVRTHLILPVAIIATLVIHTLFYKFLRVPLPWGPLQSIAW